MTSIETLLAERESAIERLRRAYGFSECEAIYFLDRFPVENPVEAAHVEQDKAE